MKENRVLCKYCKNHTLIYINNYKSHLQKAHYKYFNKQSELFTEIQDGLLNHVNFLKDNVENLLLETEKLDSKITEYKINEQKIIDEKTIKINLIWDDIYFDENLIRFKTNRINTIIQPVFQKGVFKSLNNIMEDYFKRLYPNLIFNIIIYEGQILTNESIGLKKIIDTIEFAIEYYRYNDLTTNTKIRIFRASNLSNDQIIDIFSNQFKSNQYLRFLANKLTNDHKILPIKEFINNHWEESFLFRINTKKNKSLILWENVNPSRATHYFINENENKHVKEIEEFIARDDMNYKRSLLYCNNEINFNLKKSMGYQGAIRHTTLERYKIEILNLIELY